MATISEQQLSIGLSLAVAEAKKARLKQNYPYGAVITTLNGNVIAKAHNRVKPLHDPTAHAEVEVIRKAGMFLRNNKRQSILYTTIEPCLMCIGAILASDISVLVWGVNDSNGGAVNFTINSYRKEKIIFPQIISEPLPEISMQICELMRSWEISRGRSPQNWIKW